MSDRPWIFSAGALFAGLAVAAGAFAAHALKSRLSADALALFETAVRYQALHALALLATAWAGQRWPGRLPEVAAALFVVGILLFCGSLYAMSLGATRTLGLLTPIGGVAWLLGWSCMVVAPWRLRPTSATEISGSRNPAAARDQRPDARRHG